MIVGELPDTPPMPFKCNGKWCLFHGGYVVMMDEGDLVVAWFQAEQDALDYGAAREENDGN